MKFIEKLAKYTNSEHIILTIIGKPFIEYLKNFQFNAESRSFSVIKRLNNLIFSANQ
jgi:hypothetical protein